MKQISVIAFAVACLCFAETANAQIIRFGWFQRCQPCQSCQRSTCPSGTCQATSTCSTETCLSDPVKYPVDALSESDAGSDDDLSDCECAECPLTELESALVKEIVRVRGTSCLKLRFDAACNRRAQLNANRQASACQLGHFTGDPNEIAGRGYTSARAAVAGWLNSPAHRAILMRGNFTKIGACVRKGRDGLFYWSVNFGY